MKLEEITEPIQVVFLSQFMTQFSNVVGTILGLGLSFFILYFLFFVANSFFQFIKTYNFNKKHKIYIEQLALVDDWYIKSIKRYRVTYNYEVWLRNDVLNSEFRITIKNADLIKASKDIGITTIEQKEDKKETVEVDQVLFGGKSNEEDGSKSKD